MIKFIFSGHYIFLGKEILLRSMTFQFDQISLKQVELKLINCLMGVVIFIKPEELLLLIFLYVLLWVYTFRETTV